MAICHQKTSWKVTIEYQLNNSQPTCSMTHCTLIDSKLFGTLNSIHNSSPPRLSPDIRTLYTRLSKKCKAIIFICIFSSRIAHCIFAWKKNCIQQKQLQLKNNLLLFPEHICTHENFSPKCIFYHISGQKKKPNEWKNRLRMFRVGLVGEKKSISCFPYWCCAIFYARLSDTRCRFNSMEKILKKYFPRISSRSTLFNCRMRCEKSNFSSGPLFYGRKPKMNIWQIATGYSDN